MVNNSLITRASKQQSMPPESLVVPRTLLESKANYTLHQASNPQTTNTEAPKRR